MNKIDGLMDVPDFNVISSGRCYHRSEMNMDVWERYCKWAALHAG